MASLMPSDLKALSLSASILLSTYITYLSGTPPNPTPYNSTNPGSIRHLVSPVGLFIRRFINASYGIYHAYLCLMYPLLYDFMTCITMILLGGYIRLSALSALGTSFTFRLASPKTLVTSGLYNYVQHPSYAGKIMIVLGNWALFQSLHGPVGCFLPTWIVEATLFWRALACLVVFGVNHVTWKRVKEEERMLKDTFGKEWEASHAKTKRFIPGLI